MTKENVADATAAATARSDVTRTAAPSRHTSGGKASETHPQEESHPTTMLLGVLVLAAVLSALLACVVFGLTRPKHPKRTPSTQRPHIIFILADDMGWADVSYTGTPQIRTPNIDALAWNGVRLSRLYHQPVCTPTRSTIMSGLYPIHTGLQHFVIFNEEPRGLPLELKILPEWLNDMGYTSYMVGKWHLGFCKAAYTPTRRGFVTHMGNFGGAIDYFNHTRASAGYFGVDFWRNLTHAVEDHGVYYTDLITTEVKRIIKGHQPDKPMFLYVAHFAPHYSSSDDRLETPDHYTKGHEFINHVNRTLYAGMVTALDKSVGEIISSLDEAGILNNSFIVFASDNGAPATFWDAHAASPWPLRGEKDTLFEGGVRVPGIVWAPESLRQRIGSEYLALFHATDWLPTLYELAGGDVRNVSKLDGVSHLKSLRDPAAGAPRTEVLLNIDSKDGNAAFISDHYKLVNGTFPRASSDWLPLPGHREKADVESQHARDACMNSPTFKVFKKLGLNPTCGEKGSTYATAISCGEKDKTKPTCNSSQAPCLFDVFVDPCEYNNLAQEKPQLVQDMMSRIHELQKTALKPSNVPRDPASSPKDHGGLWVTWKDDVPL